MKPGEIIDYRITAEVVGEYDVIVCGAGASGCSAAIAAARSGARTLLLEASAFIGGMLTEGNAGLTNFVRHGADPDLQTLINARLRNERGTAQIIGGIALEFAQRLIDGGSALGTCGTAGTYVYTDKEKFKILLFEMMREAGVDVLLRAPVCDTFVSNGRIEAVVIQTKLGRKAYTAERFIDATGDGDVAALSGVPFVLGVGEEDSVYLQGKMKLGDQQEIGAMFRIGGVDFDKYIAYIRNHPEKYSPTRAGQMTLDEFILAYERGDMINSIGIMESQRFQIYNYPQKGIMVGCLSLPGARQQQNKNGLDVCDVSAAEFEVLQKAADQVEKLRREVPGFENAFVLDTPSAGIRETRHIVGEYRLNIVDILNRVEFPDSIALGSHPIDVAPVPEEVENWTKPDEWFFSIPYRCMVPKNIDNLLVSGRCASTTREAFGCIRPTAQCIAMGEAAGIAAAMLVGTGTAAKDVDIKALQTRLREVGAVIE